MLLTITLRVITGRIGVREFGKTTALATSPIGWRDEETWTVPRSRSRRGEALDLAIGLRDGRTSGGAATDEIAESSRGLICGIAM
jgi:hypothetical protein